MKVFFSWQSDLPSETHRNLIKAALSQALAELSEELELEEADRPNVDEATTGTVGMVDIVQVILEKISQSMAFVCDITPIGSVINASDAVSRGERVVCNPNVTYELGFAFAKPGPQAIVAVMNTDRYALEALPFDLRTKRVLAYNLPAKPSDSVRRNARAKLKADLVLALRPMFQPRVEAPTAVPEIVGVASRDGFPSIWKGSTGFNFSSMLGPERTLVRIESLSQRSYARIIPERWVVPDISTVAESSDYLQPAQGVGSSGDNGAVDFGYVKLWYSDSDETGKFAQNAAAFHETTGEWWFIESTSAHSKGGITTFAAMVALDNWRRALRQANTNLDALNAPSRRKLVVGASGIKDARWPGKESRLFRWESVEHEETRDSWTAIDEQEFLMTAYNKVRNGFALPPLDHGEFMKVLNHVIING